MNYGKRRMQRTIGEKTFTMREENTSIHNILITTGAGIGNLINLTPLIIIVKREYPDANIDLLTLKRHEGMLNGWDGIRNIYVCPDNMPVDMEYDFVIEGMSKVVAYK